MVGSIVHPYSRDNMSYEKHYKIYGFELDKDFCVALRNILVPLICNENTCLDTECLICAWKTDGINMLPELYQDFYLAYRGDRYGAIVFGIVLSSASSYRAIDMKKVYDDTSVSETIKEQFKEKVLALPKEIQEAISISGLEPDIVYVVEQV